MIKNRRQKTKMNIFENTKENIRTRMQNFLQINKKQTATNLVINQDLSHEANTALHKILYRSNAYEAEQAFKQIAGSTADLGRFWASAPSKDRNIRKIRNDLYSLIIDTYSDICTSGMNYPDFEKKEDEDLFFSIFSTENEQAWDNLVKDAITKALTSGDGAFKISLDTELSEYPILEFWDAENVDYKYKRGKLQEIIFLSHFKENDRIYTLEEHYGKGYISNYLYDDQGNPQSLLDFEITKDIQDITFEGDYIMAQKLEIWKSPKYENRGKPLLDGKIDEIDALDEVISQWMDALRRGRVTRYIPNDLIPRDKDGRLAKPNAFDNDYIAIGSGLTDKTGQVQVVQPDIQYEAFVESYVNGLQRVLTGVISPSTLGIDPKKYDDNATAQRERQKITSWRRTQICNVLIDVLPALINKTIKTYQNLNNKTITDIKVEICFDKYDSPNIEEKIEIASKAAPGSQVMTWEQIAKIIADDIPESEQLALAEQLEKLNGTTYEIPSMFPTDYQKDEQDVSQLEQIDE